jgi:hypothetical protein
MAELVHVLRMFRAGFQMTEEAGQATDGLGCSGEGDWASEFAA